MHISNEFLFLIWVHVTGNHSWLHFSPLGWFPTLPFKLSTFSSSQLSGQFTFLPFCFTSFVIFSSIQNVLFSNSLFSFYQHRRKLWRWQNSVFPSATFQTCRQRCLCSASWPHNEEYVLIHIDLAKSSHLTLLDVCQRHCKELSKSVSQQAHASSAILMAAFLLHDVDQGGTKWDRLIPQKKVKRLWMQAQVWQLSKGCPDTLQIRLLCKTSKNLWTAGHRRLHLIMRRDWEGIK